MVSVGAKDLSGNALANPYYRVGIGTRLAIAAVYFGLIAILAPLAPQTWWRMFFS